MTGASVLVGYSYIEKEEEEEAEEESEDNVRNCDCRNAGRRRLRVPKQIARDELESILSN
jgi:hypothetical protein